MSVEALGTRPAGGEAAPGLPPVASPLARPRRRRRGLILLAGALAVGAIAYLMNYVPFLPANGSGGISSGVHREELGFFRSPGGENFRVTRYGYLDDATFFFAFGLRNDGPLPVTVRDLRSDAIHGPGSLVAEDVWIARSPEGSPPWYGDRRQPGGEPFRTFSLAPGEERWVSFEERFQGCDRLTGEKGTSNVEDITRVLVSYRILGVIPRHGWVPLFDESQVVYADGNGCPRSPSP